MLPATVFAVSGKMVVSFSVLFLEQFVFPPAFGCFLVLFGFVEHVFVVDDACNMSSALPFLKDFGSFFFFIEVCVLFDFFKEICITPFLFEAEYLGFSAFLLFVSSLFVLECLVDLFDLAILNDPLTPRPFTCFIKPFLIPALRASFKCLLVEFLSLIVYLSLMYLSIACLEEPLRC